MKTIVLYKTKYGSTRTYAKWIAEELNCEYKDVAEVKVDDLLKYDNIILGGGLYANSIAGANLITKNYNKLKNKNLVFYTTGITPLDCRDYYDRLVIEKTFPEEMRNNVKVFNFLGKMLIEELSFAHRNALKYLKKLMQGKENPTEMEKMLIDLCDVDADMTDKKYIYDLVNYVKNLA